MSLWRATQATRYLSTAVYLNRPFRRAFLGLLVRDRHRAIATSPGVDLEVAACHCFAAHTLEVLRDALLAIVVLLAMGVLTAMVGAELGAQPGAWRWLALAGGVSWGAGAAIVFWHLWLVEVRTVARRMGREQFGRASVPPAASALSARAIAEVRQSQAGNARVHSGFWPFVGSGVGIGGWSFALDVEKGSSSFGVPVAPERVDTSEMYDQLTRSLSELDLDGLSVSDRVFVNGRDLRRGTHGEPRSITRPGTQLSDDLVSELADESAVRARHYRCVEVVAWDGELVLSIFLRLRRNGRLLFVEANHSLLAPVKDPLTRADALSADPDLLQRAAFVGRAVCISGPALLLAVPRTLFRAVDRLLRSPRDRFAARRVRRDPTIDHGASVSIRELAQSAELQRWFQALDREMYLKVIDRCLLDALIAFLDDKGVDTSDLRERQTTILNSGVIMTGGSIHGTSIAMGASGHALTHGRGAASHPAAPTTPSTPSTPAPFRRR
jgi:hypothetical protein